MNFEEDLREILKEFEGVPYTEDNLLHIQSKIKAYLEDNFNIRLEASLCANQDIENIIVSYNLEFKEDN